MSNTPSPPIELYSVRKHTPKCHFTTPLHFNIPLHGSTHNHSILITTCVFSIWTPFVRYIFTWGFTHEFKAQKNRLIEMSEHIYGKKCLFVWLLVCVVVRKFCSISIQLVTSQVVFHVLHRQHAYARIVTYWRRLRLCRLVHLASHTLNYLPFARIQAFLKKCWRF